MLHLKRKALTPEQEEQRRTKDFFDLILPGTIRFLTDHYIVGDSFRCVWVLREYPPSTEEQAVLAQLADRAGVTLRMYHRLVDAAGTASDRAERNAQNKLMSGGSDVSETVEAAGNLQDVVDLLANLRRNRRPASALCGISGAFRAQHGRTAGNCRAMCPWSCPAPS